jgi:hypothetical protein
MNTVTSGLPALIANTEFAIFGRDDRRKGMWHSFHSTLLALFSQPDAQSPLSGFDASGEAKAESNDASNR